MCDEENDVHAGVFYLEEKTIPVNMVICGDSLKLMKEMPDSIIDLTVTSPPYDNLRDYKGYSFDFENIAKELFRITKEGGVLVWVVGDATINGSETGTSFKQALFFKEVGFNLYDTMIYKKKGLRFPDSSRYYQSFEYMFVLSKGKPKTINLLEDRENIYKGSKVARKTQDRYKDGELRPNSAFRIDKERVVKDFGVRFNIWEYSMGGNVSKDSFAFKHPAIFPEELAKDHILSWSNEGDLVFDLFCGSGTTLKMAKQNGRNYLGFDISEEYCKISEKRVNQESLLSLDVNQKEVAIPPIDKSVGILANDL